MHRSSDSIAMIATGLAEAQIEMSNPLKSKIGCIHRNNSNSQPQFFRYATLSGGLDILRKVLGAKQIAIVQTTAINEESKSINLTTSLIHASGEWISSEWPVCHLDDMTAPRRMGAALTYARRYALFALAGVAGEEDLDAPDLQSPRDFAASITRLTIPTSGKHQNSPNTSISPHTAQKLVNERDDSSRAESRIHAETLIESAETFDDLSARAAQILKLKNRLPIDAAKAIEALFAAKLISLQRNESLSTITAVNDPSLHSSQTALGGQSSEKPLQRHNSTHPTTCKSKKFLIKSKSDSVKSKTHVRDNAIPQKIEKAELTFGEPRRLRDKNHLRFVASNPCLVCGRSPSDAHHLRFAQPRALGKKVSDEFTVPLCRTHHRDNHQHGNELLWWETLSIDPIQTANSLWQMSRVTV